MEVATTRSTDPPGCLRALARTAGIGWSVIFVVVGLRYQLELYADGSIFAYAVAVDDAWAFHWHNIISRIFVYVFAYFPAQLYLGATSDAHGAIDVYAFLFFVAPLLGLTATLAADASKRGVLFTFACLSTACLDPLVFGFPTEMWIAHSLFWPALALSHYARPGIAGALLVLAVLLALAFTHEGGLIFAVAILATLLLRRGEASRFLRSALALLAIALIWITARMAFPADPYVGDALRRAALHVLDPSILAGDMMLLLLGRVASYVILFVALRRWAPLQASVYAGVIVAAGLTLYWLWFDHALHAENRYYMRTVLLVVTPMLGFVAAVLALDAQGALRFGLPPRIKELVTNDSPAWAIAGALALVMLVHAVETAKFVTAWTRYMAAVRALATGQASDPALGDARFVSSQRIGSALNRLAWFSTTPYLSVLLAPDFAPSRLVVDPSANYFWLSCETATANRDAVRAVPAETRELVRVHACMHR